MNKVLLYGDSLLMDIKELEPFALSNESTLGLTSEDALATEAKGLGLSFLLQEDDYRYLILSLGTNDLGHEISHAEVAQNLVKLLVPICSNEEIDFVPTRIFIVDIPYSSKTQTTLFRKTILEAKDKIPTCVSLRFITFNPSKTETTDGLHLNSQGLERIKKEIISNMVK